jgi:phytoene synthase
MPDPSPAAPLDETLRAAFAHCEGLARSHYENFPVASRILPRNVRPHVAAIYAFARTADDYADEARFEGGRLERIDAWEARLDAALAGRADHPVFVALSDTVRRFDIPDRLLRDLLDAFRQDCVTTRYASWDELLDYCRRSANPVGRLVLHLFGYRDEQRGAWSDAICTALQLTNFWQDVAVDRDKGRIYLPEDDRRRHGVTEDELLSGRPGPGFPGLMAEVIERTRARFDAGRPLPGSVRGRLAAELRCVWWGGWKILDKIEAVDYDVFRRRPTLSRTDVVLAAGRAAWRSVVG